MAFYELLRKSEGTDWEKIGSENWNRDILVNLDICNHNDDSFLKIPLVLRTSPSSSVQEH